MRHDTMTAEITPENKDRDTVFVRHFRRFRSLLPLCQAMTIAFKTFFRCLSGKSHSLNENDDEVGHLLINWTVSVMYTSCSDDAIRSFGRLHFLSLTVCLCLSLERLRNLACKDTM